MQPKYCPSKSTMKLVLSCFVFLIIWNYGDGAYSNPGNRNCSCDESSDTTQTTECLGNCPSFEVKNAALQMQEVGTEKDPPNDDQVPNWQDKFVSADEQRKRAVETLGRVEEEKQMLGNKHRDLKQSHDLVLQQLKQATEKLIKVEESKAELPIQQEELEKFRNSKYQVRYWKDRFTEADVELEHTKMNLKTAEEERRTAEAALKECALGQANCKQLLQTRKAVAIFFVCGLLTVIVLLFICLMKKGRICFWSKDGLLSADPSRRRTAPPSAEKYLSS